MFDLELKWNRPAKLSAKKTTHVLRVRLSPKSGENGPELPEVVLRLIPTKPEEVIFKKFCRLYPQYLSLDKTDSDELMIGTVQRNIRTDVLMELDIKPDFDFCGPPGLVEVIKVQLRVGKEKNPISKSATINFTNTLDADVINDDVERDRVLWNTIDPDLPKKPKPDPPVPPPPPIDKKYRVLEAFLETKKWKEADAETVNLILKEAGREKKGYLNLNSINDFPCDVLRTINDLWVKYSDGKFGFSVQNRIWKEVGGDSNPNSQTYEKFCDRVGWRSPIFWDVKMWYYNNLQFNIDAPEGHLPSGRSGDIALKKKIVGKFGGFGLERICALTSKLDRCDIK